MKQLWIDKLTYVGTSRPGAKGGNGQTLSGGPIMIRYWHRHLKYSPIPHRRPMIILQDLKIILLLWLCGSREPSKFLLRNSKLLNGNGAIYPSLHSWDFTVEEQKMSPRAHPPWLSSGMSPGKECQWLVGQKCGYEGATHASSNSLLDPLRDHSTWGIWSSEFIHIRRVHTQATRSTLTSSDKWALSITMRLDIKD